MQSFNDIWEGFLYLSSSETAQKYLFNQYQFLPAKDARKKSFQNGYSFIYHLEQGIQFFRQAKNASFSIQPILIFYGFSFFLKAAILTVDPDYPETTAVLAHGVSTRKRKKQDYRYFDDEVKIQKNGLFPHLCKNLFHENQRLPGGKTRIIDLLIQVPELFPFLKQEIPGADLVPLENDGQRYYLPDKILSSFYRTEERFFEYILEKTNEPKRFNRNGKKIYFTVETSPMEVLPFRYHIFHQQYYFPDLLSDVTFFPEIWIHYLLLFHLSMIARYEIEWWSELIAVKPSIEYPVIKHYIHVAQKKCPLLIGQVLFAD